MNQFRPSKTCGRGWSAASSSGNNDKPHAEGTRVQLNQMPILS